MADGNVKKLPVFQWSEKQRHLLYQTIVNKCYDSYNLKKSDILKVLATGTRSYKINSDIKVFTDDSDLDVIIQVLPKTYKQLLDQVNNSKFKYPVENPLVTVRFSFVWNDIYVSCFILPSDYNHLKYFSVQTMAVDLLTNKIYGEFNIDLYEYLISKNRLEPDRVCHICGKYISDNVYKVSYSYIDTYQGPIYDGITILCKDCYNKVLQNKSLATILKEYYNAIRNKR